MGATPLPKNGLRWQAEDSHDLTLLSSALQDGIVEVGNISYDRKGRNFTLLLSRFRWELDDYGKGQRVAAALRIDSVLAVKARGINRTNPEGKAVLLSCEFVADDEPPSGQMRLVFAGGGEIAIDVECIDAMLVDIANPRNARARPDHSDG